MRSRRGAREEGGSEPGVKGIMRKGDDHGPGGTLRSFPLAGSPRSRTSPRRHADGPPPGSPSPTGPGVRRSRVPPVPPHRPARAHTPVTLLHRPTGTPTWSTYWHPFTGTFPLPRVLLDRYPVASLRRRWTGQCEQTAPRAHRGPQDALGSRVWPREGIGAALRGKACVGRCGGGPPREGRVKGSPPPAAAGLRSRPSASRSRSGRGL